MKEFYLKSFKEKDIDRLKSFMSKVILSDIKLSVNERVDEALDIFMKTNGGKMGFTDTLTVVLPIEFGGELLLSILGGENNDHN
ncbi:MAG: hypothetical protein KKH70_20495 [Gammaproteobacteria bacterium]|uniref:Uncharacterized protein n=1 Tax=viral metagenome TaxID=1070528 RepID=A0A6M3LQP0_9ZZZZ|nr:hypothetical protein [Gammaproteobacteria bacterium]MBU2249309.1 hypothetical protein [Gammaproteobacteria bacterium]MBU2395721.1 hypothetical protein [Gammaproteobacteria bacterium]